MPKPINIEDLDMTDEELAAFAEGARELFGEPEENEDGTRERPSDDVAESADNDDES